MKTTISMDLVKALEMEPDLMELVMQHLTPVELMKATTVSKDWNAIVGKTKSFSNKAITISVVERVVGSFRKKKSRSTLDVGALKESSRVYHHLYLNAMAPVRSDIEWMKTQQWKKVLLRFASHLTSQQLKMYLTTLSESVECLELKDIQVVQLPMLLASPFANNDINVARSV